MLTTSSSVLFNFSLLEMYNIQFSWFNSHQIQFEQQFIFIAIVVSRLCFFQPFDLKLKNDTLTLCHIFLLLHVLFSLFLWRVNTRHEHFPLFSHFTWEIKIENNMKNEEREKRTSVLLRIAILNALKCNVIEKHPDAGIDTQREKTGLISLFSTYALCILFRRIQSCIFHVVLLLSSV